MENHPSTVSVLADCVTIVEMDDIKVVRVSHPKATADISLHGGHLLSFKPAGQEDVIWLSEKAEFHSDKAIRGGIPICWPWFGRIAAPAHGFARTTQWHLVEHRENDHGVMICLGLEEDENTLAVWPFSFQARLYIDISDKLKVTLDVRNTDDKPWRFSAALHSYFNIANIADSVTTGMGLEYRDSLQDGKVCQGLQQLRLTDTVDRVYTKPTETIQISDPQHARNIVIKNQGHNSAVIWNPWQQGSQGMADMADDGYQTMLCVESTYHATSLETGLELQPEQSYQLSTEISVQ